MENICLTPIDADARERIDRWLSRHLAEQHISRSQIKQLIQSGYLSADDKTLTDPSAQIKAGSEYCLSLPEAEKAEPMAENIALDILFEDAHLIILNKPAGMVVHPAPGSHSGTLVNALLYHCGDSLTGIGGVMRPGIVHRLDKDTSGVMMAAKTDRAHQRLTEMFAAHDLDRCYHALVWGTLADRDGRIEAPLGRSNRDRKQQAVVPNGRFAATNWTGLRQMPPFASLVECRLETGRTHQIRVHMAHIGHGVIGDPVYGRALRSGQMPDNVARTCLAAMRDFERQALHAARLGFDHPVTGQPLSFETGMPDDMIRLVTTIEDAIAARARDEGS